MIDTRSNSKIILVKDAVVMTESNDDAVADIDLAGYESALIAISRGIQGEAYTTEVYSTVKLEHSDTTTSGDYAVVAAADVVGVTPASGIIYTSAATAADRKLIGYVGGKRYLRITPDIVGTHTGGGTPYAICVIAQNARQQPTA